MNEELPNPEKLPAPPQLPNPEKLLLPAENIKLKNDLDPGSDPVSDPESGIESDPESGIESDPESDPESGIEADIEETVKKGEKILPNKELNNIFKHNINSLNFDKNILEKNKDNLKTKQDLKYYFNAIELLNRKFLNNKNDIVDDTLAYNNKPIKHRFDYLYPHLDDEFFNIKISKKKEFSEFKHTIDLKKLSDIENEANKLCNQPFELSPHQKFINNFLSENTPYNGILLYHGLGTGKTCSAIGIAEETRHYMKYNNIQKQILIVASPNVQQNFRLQLFNETKLEYVNDKWEINNCAGNNFLDEINMLKTVISKKKVISIVNNIINNYYSFLGYIEFANLINKHSNINNILESNPTLSSKKKNLLIKNKLKKFFDNRLIVIDEIHNIRDSKENSNKLVAKHLYNLVKNADNMKLVLLSATPMFNDYREIVFLINLLNMNDKRNIIDVNDVFTKNGDFVKDNEDNESGKYLLQRKLNGYVSYVKGDNPLIFPYRILPVLYDNLKSSKNHEFIYPIYNILNERLQENTKINYFDLYMSSMHEYQEKIYKYVISKINFKEHANADDSYKYTDMLKPIEALNIVYPNQLIESTAISDIESLTLDIKKLTGKTAINKYMTYDQDAKALSRFNYSLINDKDENIFLRANIRKYSSKIANILDAIENSKGPIIVYSQFIDGGLIPLALALEGYGFKRYGTTKPLFEKEPTEELDINTYKPKSRAQADNNGKFRCAKYIMITGNKFLSSNKKEELEATNDSNNIYGENVKVILLSSAGSEGLDFKFIRQIHILEPWYNINRIEQIIGRGVRTCSHIDLPLKERNVKIYMHASLLSNPTIETVDLLIYRKSEEKAKQIGKITRILKEVSVDCQLNYDFTNLNAEKLKQITNNKYKLTLSNNEEIDYFIGDKPFTAICDYMESCEYKCYPDITEYDNEDKDEDEEKSSMKTYNDKFLVTINSKLIKIIGDLFKESYFYSKEDIIKFVNVHDNFSLLNINSALDELINNEYQIITDSYNNPGKIININTLYIYQPLALNNNNTSLYNKRTPLLEKTENINFNSSNDAYTDKTKQYTDESTYTNVDKKVDDVSPSIGPYVSPNKSIFNQSDFNIKLKLSEETFQNLILNLKFVLMHNPGDKTNKINKKYIQYQNLNLIFKIIQENKEIFTIDNESLKYIILNILIENHDITLQDNLIFYVYNNGDDYMNMETTDSAEIEDMKFNKETIIMLKKYYDNISIAGNIQNVDYIGFVFPLKSDYNNYTLRLLKSHDAKIILKDGEQMDYNRLNDLINNKFKFDISKYHNKNPIGFTIPVNATKLKLNFYDFKIKLYLNADKKYNPGRICNNFHRIEEKNEFFNSLFFNEIQLKKLNNLIKEKKLGIQVCIISEIFFRYFELIKYDNKKWFLDMPQSLISKFIS